MVEITASGAGYSVAISEGESTSRLDGAALDSEQGSLSWSGADGEYGNGKLHFSANPLTGASIFHGAHWSTGTEPSEGAENWQGNATGVRPPMPVGDNQVPARVFEILGTIGLEGSDPASLFIWSRWQRACFTSRLANRFVPKVIEAIAENK